MASVDERITELRKLFPVVEHWTYLYNGSIHPCPVPVAEAMKNFLGAWSDGGEAAVFPAFEAFDRLKAMLARLIGADPANIAITESTTAAINLAARLIQPRAGQNIVVTDLAFMSNTYPWLVSYGDVVETRFAESRNGKIYIEDLAGKIDANTAAVHICSVTVGSGYRYNLREVHDLVAPRNIPLLIDGAQAVGLVDVDVQNPPIDFLAGTMSKWLMGPAGLGYLYVADRFMDARPPAAGWFSAANVADWNVRECRLHTDATRFQGGIPNLIGVVGALAGLELLEEIGREFIEQRVRSLTRYAYDGLLSLGVSLWTPPEDGERAGIVFFRTPGHNDLHAKLKAARIYCGNFSGGIRIDPNFYNTEEELDRFLSVVKKHVSG